MTQALLNQLPETLTRLHPGAKRWLTMAVDLMLLMALLPVMQWLVSGGFERGVVRPVAEGAILALGVVIALNGVGVYRCAVRFATMGLAARLLAGIAIALVAYLLFDASGLLPLMPWNQAVLWAAASLLTLSTLRFVVGGWLNGMPLERQSRRALIYGAGEAGRQMARGLSDGKAYRLVGYLDDNPKLRGRIVHGVPVFLPSESELQRLIDKRRVQTVLLAMANVGRARRAEIHARLTALGLEVLTMPGIDEIALGKCNVSDVRHVRVQELMGRDVVTPNSELLDANVLGKAVLVTGAGGSIGSELARQCLLRRPALLVLLDASEVALYQIERELREAAWDQGTTLVPVLGSVLNRGLLREVLSAHAIHTVFHAAAYKHVPLIEANVAVGVGNNVRGALCLLEACVAAKVKKFVNVSTDKAVRPTSVMGASKRVAEMLSQVFAQKHPEMEVAIVRFGNVLDSSGSVVPLFKEQIRKGGPVTVTHEDVTRYFMSIPEAAQLVMQAGAMGRHGDVFVLDMGEPIRIMEMARRMIELSGFTVRDQDNPRGDIEIQVTGLRPGEKLYEELLIGQDERPTSHPRIRVASEGLGDAQKLAQRVEELLAAVDRRSDGGVRAALGALIPEFSGRKGGTRSGDAMRAEDSPLGAARRRAEGQAPAVPASAA